MAPIVKGFALIRIVCAKISTKTQIHYSFLVLPISCSITEPVDVLKAVFIEALPFHIQAIITDSCPEVDLRILNRHSGTIRGFTYQTMAGTCAHSNAAIASTTFDIKVHNCLVREASSCSTRLRRMLIYASRQEYLMISWMELSFCMPSVFQASIFFRRSALYFELIQIVCAKIYS